MRIAIDATAIGSGRGGDETYLRGLLAGLAEAAAETDRFTVYLRAAVPPPAALVAHPAFLWRSIVTAPAVRFGAALPLALLREPRPDVLSTLTHLPPLSTVPRALTVTDLSFRHHPEFYPPSTRARLGLAMPLQVRLARAVLTLSEFCRRDLIDSYGLAPDKVFVVPCAILAEPRATAPPPRPGGAAPYFVYVGNLNPRKNVDGLIDAFARAARHPGLERHELLVIGARWFSSGAPRATAPRVRFLGRVSDGERDSLVGGADALVYPSRFEGFGLPPLEAMALGTPVLTTTAGAIPETVGDAALLRGPDDIDGMAEALVRLATDAALRADLRVRGYARVARYRPRGTGEAALRAFRWAAGAGQREALARVTR
ncbi:MAG TPA: glycosyltransferase family 1 protein [Candidatus Limnocylindria bacterium]|nr:glycosyltransferase family 1 protein [Candidatus Limnocylindria bacterium]